MINEYLEFGTKELYYKYKKDTPCQTINGKTMKREKFIPKQVIDEDVPAFMGALAQAAKDGKKEFEFGGKTFKVKLKKDVVDKITKNMKESEDLDDLFIDGIISDIIEATAADYAKLSDTDLKDLFDIFKNVGRSAAKPVILAIKREMQKRSMKEAVELEEANNRLVAHSPAAAQRLIKKLKNKFSGYTWDQRIKGNEVIYPMEPHIIRFIKKQPEVADMKESVELEEAKKYEAGKYYAKFGGRVVGPYDTEKDAYHDTKGDIEWIKKGKDIKESTELEEAIKVKTHRGMYSMKKGEQSLRHWVDGIVIMSDAVKKNQRKTVAQNIVKAIESGKIKNADLTQDLGALIGIKSPKGMEAPANVVKAKLKDLGLSESTEIEEAKAPFAALEKDWLRVKGVDTPRATKTRERLIKKYNLKPIISSVRPGSIKLGPLNDLKMKMGDHTIAGLDAEGELIFVTNNPVKIYYPSNTKKRPEGGELMSESVSLDILRLRRVVEISLNESIQDIDTFILEASIDMTMTPSAIQKAHKKYMIERKGVPQYEIYHKSYSDAVQSAKSFAKGSGYEVDEDDWFNQVTSGPRKPSKDKMNRFSIVLNKNGKPQKKRLQIQVTNLGTSGRTFELNAYIA